MGTVLETLRAETRASHRRLEARLGVPERLGTMERRRVLMGRIYGFYAAAEDALEPSLGRIPRFDFSRRRKAGILARDLAALGLSEDRLKALPRIGFAAPPTRPEALGCAYVMEGASLGGRVIRKQVVEAGLDLTGLAFFGCYGDETGIMWRRFCMLLETCCRGSSETKEAVGGAVGTFDAMGTWLCGPPDG